MKEEKYFGKAGFIIFAVLSSLLLGIKLYYDYDSSDVSIMVSKNYFWLSLYTIFLFTFSMFGKIQTSSSIVELTPTIEDDDINQTKKLLQKMILIYKYNSKVIKIEANIFILTGSLMAIIGVLLSYYIFDLSSKDKDVSLSFIFFRFTVFLFIESIGYFFLSRYLTIIKEHNYWNHVEKEKEELLFFLNLIDAYKIDIKEHISFFSPKPNEFKPTFNTRIEHVEERLEKFMKAFNDIKEKVVTNEPK